MRAADFEGRERQGGRGARGEGAGRRSSGGRGGSDGGGGGIVGGGEDAGHRAEQVEGGAREAGVGLVACVRGVRQ